MQRVDFYLLPHANPNARYPFVCRLLEKAHAKGNKVFINCHDKQQAHLIDELLWTYKDNSFIPHNLLGEGPTPPPAIQIGWDGNTPQQKEILINLDHALFQHHQQFQRVIEIVPNDEQFKQQSREHFRYFRKNQWDVNTHRI